MRPAAGFGFGYRAFWTVFVFDGSGVVCLVGCATYVVHVDATALAFVWRDSMADSFAYTDVPFVVNPAFNLREALLKQIESRRSMSSVGRNSDYWAFRDGSLAYGTLETNTNVLAVIKYLRARETMVDWILEAPAERFRTALVPAVQPSDSFGFGTYQMRPRYVQLKRGGLTVAFEVESIHEWFHVPTRWLQDNLSRFATFVDEPGVYFTYSVKRHVRDVDGAPFAFAWETAKCAAWSDAFGARAERTQRAYSHEFDGETFARFDIAKFVLDRAWAYYALPVARQEFRFAREQYVQQQNMATVQADLQRQADSAERFERHWTAVKGQIEAVAVKSEVDGSFHRLRMPSAGTGTSRTWGIEVESANANGVTRPRGWDRKYDGSLEGVNAGSDCECQCDSCYEYGEHGECSYDSCQSETAEFVSPILSSYHSRGLKSLCVDHEGRDTNDTPGIHVHVGASDLSTDDVSRLYRIYSLASPFLWMLTERNTRGYCKDTRAQTMTYWMSQKRKGKSNIFDVASAQPFDRYHDVNTHSLNAHGTIEFRAMGPVYDYKHLVKWAWLMREFVNLSRNDAVLPLFSGVRSMEDVLRIVHEYGSEPVWDGVDEVLTSDMLMEV